MSGPDKADQDKSFLARWSQRKQEAKQPEPKPDAPVAPAPEIPSGPVAEVEAETEFHAARARIAVEGRRLAECG